jgi:hypothetical protein
MTTIASNREVMAADSKCTVDSVSFQTPKIFRKKAALIATAGDVGPGNRFIEWYGTRRKRPEVKDDEDFEALVLTPKGLVYYGKDFEPVPIADGVFAIGSGSVAALTAMKVYGATPQQAVEAACVIDEYTEGPVQVFNLKEGVGA